MSKTLKCNSCGGTYPDTRDGKQPAYFHVCPDQVIDTYATCDDKGNAIKPATFKPTPNPRNENLKPHPEKDGEFVIVSEGNGITEIG